MKLDYSFKLWAVIFFYRLVLKMAMTCRRHAGCFKLFVVECYARPSSTPACVIRSAIFFSRSSIRLPMSSSKKWLRKNMFIITDWHVVNYNLNFHFNLVYFKWRQYYLPLSATSQALLKNLKCYQYKLMHNNNQLPPFFCYI